MKIPNTTEIAVIFERTGADDEVTMFYPKKVVIGYADKKKKVFIASDGHEYPYMLSSKEKYTFALRKSVGELNKSYKEKTLTKLLEKHFLGLTQFVYYFNCDQECKDINFVCEDQEGNMYTLNDKDFESYKKHVLNPTPREIKEPVTINVNAKELINEVKKKVIGQDDAIEDIVSIIWQNSKSTRKQNILLLGPTGVGKTEIIRIIAKKLDVPLVIANASSMTQSGFVGKSVDDILADLLNKCNNNVSKAENSIIVIDEIDKLAGNSLTGNDVATTGVQDELLKLVEDGEYVINVSNDALEKNNITINTKNITFIAIGAFSELIKEKRNKQEEKTRIGFNTTNIIPKEKNEKLTTDDLVKYGLKQELIGRFTNLIELNSLTKENLIEIMKNPNEELIKNKVELLNSLGISVKIDEAVYEKLANIAIKKNTGARGLIGTVDNLFVKAMTEISQNDNIYETLTIDEKTIDNPKNYTLIKKKSNN